MAARFENIEIGDQLELPASRGTVLWGGDPNLDPDRPVRVAIVTHIWHDPVEDKEFVGIAYLRAGGIYGKPTEKRTIRGLANCGWRKAKIDWVSKLKSQGESSNVTSLFGRRPSKI